MIFFLILSILEFLIIIAGLLFYKKTGNKQNSLVETSEALAKGKLDIDDITVESNNNIGVISSGFNMIKANLLTFVESTKQNVVVLSNAVDTLNNSMKANQCGNEQIAQNTMEVDEKTMKQLDLVQDNLAAVNENSVQMQEAAAQMEIITNMLIESTKISEDGINNLEGYAKDMDIVSSDLNAINDTLKQFNDDLKRVSEVGDFIMGISNQLKLLSFNASIEAARAGQAGQGFTVVADEMTGMSEKTKEGIDRISSIISEINESSELVSKSIKKCTDTYNESKVTFEAVNKSFRTINDNSTDIQKKIEDINVKFEVIADNTEKSKNVAMLLNETAKDISEKTSEIAGVSQEVTAESLQIGANTEALSDMVDSIRKMLKRFNTGIVPTQTRSAKQIKIALMSMYDNEFWYGVGRGAVYASKELGEFGAKIEYIPLAATNDQTLDEFILSNVKRLIEEHYDGIIYPGFIGGVEPLLKRAKDEGIKLMTYNCDSSNKMLREACLCPDSISQGMAAGKAAVNLTGGSGKIGILMGPGNVLGNVERNKGFRNYLCKYKNINITEEVSITDVGQDIYNKTFELLKRNKELDVLYITNGFLIEAAKAIEAAGLKGKTCAIGFDINPELVPYVKSGVVGTVINQDSFGQGHDPIVYMYNHIVDKTPYPSELISARSSVIDKSNINDLI